MDFLRSFLEGASDQNLDRFSIQIAEGVSFNSDIFEANLINLIILGGGLFYLLSESLSESLSKRQQKILEAIQESEAKLEEASKCLAQGNMELDQAKVVIESIEKDAEVTAKQIKRVILDEGKIEKERLLAAAKGRVDTIETRARKKIVQGIILVALEMLEYEWSCEINSGLPLGNWHQVFTETCIQRMLKD